MESYTLPQIVVILFGGSGIATFIISLAVYLTNRFDKRREQKIEEFNKALVESADIKRLELEYGKINSQTVIEQLWKMLEMERDNIVQLTQELRQARQVSDKMSKSVRESIAAVRKSLHHVAVLLSRSQAEKDLELKKNIKEVLGELKIKLDELEATLP